MAVTLQQAKTYLKVDDDITDDDELISGMITAAEEYVERSTGKTNDNSSLYDLCIKLLVVHWYENRAIYSQKSGNVQDIPHSVTQMLIHIASSSAYPEETS